MTNYFSICEVAAAAESEDDYKDLLARLREGWMCSYFKAHDACKHTPKCDIDRNAFWELNERLCLDLPYTPVMGPDAGNGPLSLDPIVGREGVEGSAGIPDR